MLQSPVTLAASPMYPEGRGRHSVAVFRGRQRWLSVGWCYCLAAFLR